MSMLRHLDRCGALDDVVHLHSARNEDDADLRRAAARARRAPTPATACTLRWTGEQGRLTPDDIAELCPDRDERETFACGPGEMLDALSERWERDGDSRTASTSSASSP